MATILVTGGAGYIGSHTVRRILAAGHRVTVVDNLSSGHRGAVDPAAELVVMSLEDAGGLSDVVVSVRPEAVVHFAGAIEPGLSVTDPRRFYRTNTVGGLNLLDSLAAVSSPPPVVVFSSSSAVYGEPTRLPMGEDDPTVPTSVYGETKLAFEQMLAAYGRAYGLRSMCLRYFNVIGATPAGDLGADHRYRVHLVTRALMVALGQLDHVDVYGDDYPTPDGTCIRDYIHVEDLAAAHVLALDRLLAGGPSDAVNVGLGRGFSVAEVLAAVERVTGLPIARQVAPRREGDPSTTVAGATKIAAVLGWAPEWTDLDGMVASAWKWHAGHPGGFDG